MAVAGGMETRLNSLLIMSLTNGLKALDKDEKNQHSSYCCIGPHWDIAACSAGIFA